MGEVEAHPGYQLRVCTLGSFRVWRGEAEIEPQEWKRATARQLFRFLITSCEHWLHREEIIERLWPDRPADAGLRDFKVALTALNKALEPKREPDSPYAFIAREGTAYRLRPEADLWIDADAFESACEEGLRLLDEGNQEEAEALLRHAVDLYEGDYLPDAIYEDWTSQTRERLLSLFLRSADRLAEVLLERRAYRDCIDICQRILSHDPCWENAYCLQMLAHTAQGDRALALRIYSRCVDSLQQHLGVCPSPDMREAYKRLAGDQ